MQEVLINRLGGLSLPRKSVVRLTDHRDMTLDVYRGCKMTIEQQQNTMVRRAMMTAICVWTDGIDTDYKYNGKKNNDDRLLPYLLQDVK